MGGFRYCNPMSMSGTCRVFMTALVYILLNRRGLRSSCVMGVLGSSSPKTIWKVGKIIFVGYCTEENRSWSFA